MPSELSATPEPGPDPAPLRTALRAAPGADLAAGYADPALWARAAEDPVTGPYLAAVAARAAEWRRTPIEALPFAAYRRFADDGSRAPFEAAYFGRRRRLTDLALDALARPDTDVGPVQDVLWAICDEYAWALPPHLDGLLEPEPSVPHAEQIDLFAAETAFALAEVRHLLRGRLEPLVAERVRREVVRRVLDPFLRAPQRWERMDHNWAAVCACGVGMAALYLEPDLGEERLRALTERTLAALDCFLGGYGDDGVCLEGLHYWSYGFGFFTIYAEALRRRSHGAVDLLADPGGKVERIARFPQHAFLSGAAVASFSDAAPLDALDPGLSALLSRRFPDYPRPEPERLRADPVDHCGRWGPALRAVVWSDDATDGPVAGASAPEYAARDGAVPELDAPDTELDAPDTGAYLPDAQWLVVRARTRDGREFGCAAKGGHNDEPHNHNDLGSFVVATAGEPLLADLGAGQYTREYFGPRRYDVLCTSSRGHSVPLVDDTPQRAGADAAARVLLAEHTPDRSRLRLDLTLAYPVTALASLIRDFDVHGGALTVSDTYAVAPGAAPLRVVERFVSFRPVELLGAGGARVRGRSAALLLDFRAAAAGGWRASTREHRHVAHDGTVTTVHSLDVATEVAGTEPDTTFTLRIHPE